jgi:divalent metal cation (Fe/Co/Zn/Cd) transporter
MTTAAGRAAGLRRAGRLEVASLSYNLVETVVGITAGLVAGSTALIGFGLDSVVESASAAILLWRVQAEVSGRRSTEEAERRAVKLVGLAFVALAVYVAASSVFDLVREHRPEESPVGIALACVSIVVMPWLARAKRRVAIELDSRSLEADSKQTWLCAYLSGFLLVGLTANAVFGWWWADPLSALAIAAIAANEGRELLSVDEDDRSSGLVG